MLQYKREKQSILKKMKMRMKMEEFRRRRLKQMSVAWHILLKQHEATSRS